MCGLTGVISRYLSQEEIEAFQELLVISTLRGQWGTGIVAVPEKEKKEIKIKKTEQIAAEFAYTEDFITITKGRNSLLMAHSRQPTNGSLGNDGLHPVIYEPIIGMFNGTMEHVAGVTPSKERSDTKLLYHHVATHGIDSMVKNSKGAYAMTWIDKITGHIYFLRNSQRLLFFGYEKGNNQTIFWSSEAGMLRYVLNKYYKEVSIGILPENQLVSFRIRPADFGIKPVYTRAVLPPPEPTVLALPPPKPSASVPSVPFLTQVIQNLDTLITNPEEIVIVSPSNSMPYHELVKILHSGCFNCSMPAMISDVREKRLFWISKASFICDDCYQTDVNVASYVNTRSVQ